MKFTVAALTLLKVWGDMNIAHAFHVKPAIHARTAHQFARPSSLHASPATLPQLEQQGGSLRTGESNDSGHEPRHNVRAPLKFLGPYPTLGLRFPNLSTTAQRERNETGVTLDFVLDTAANVNTIQAQVAQALSLEVAGEITSGVSATGSMEGDLSTYHMGDVQLEGLGESVFMQNLTASVLPVASPASAGLLGLAFFQSIGGGIEFDWKGNTDAGIPPSLTFYAEDIANATNGRTCVSISRIPVTQLPTVEVEINGEVFPALLDTGSPVTVLNAQAAKQAGIATVLPTANPSPRNPLAALQGRFQEAQAAAQGQVLSLFGAQGKRINLVQSTDKVNVHMPALKENVEDEDHKSVDFGEGHVYVGDLPGLAALQGLGVDAPPAVVLGTDVLRRRSHMFFRPRADEVWF